VRLAALAGGATAGVSWIISAGWLHVGGVSALIQPAVLRMVASDAVVAALLLAVVLAPLAGVILGRTALFISLAAFVATSLTLALAASRHDGVPWMLPVRGHLALACVSAALAAVGALLAVWCRESLDAAGAAVALSVVAATAVLVTGPATADWTESTIDAALLANPLIAATAASDIDLLRSDLLYRLSPISHRRFTYPAWQATTAAYGLFAASCLSLAIVRTRQKGSTE
jgi:hypothetical protein